MFEKAPCAKQKGNSNGSRKSQQRLPQTNRPQEIPFITTSSDSKEITSTKDLLPFLFSTLDIQKLFLGFAVVLA